MLVLTRKLGESIIIDNNIKITVVQIKNGSIRIGVTAPDTVVVLREELYEEALKGRTSGEGE